MYKRGVFLLAGIMFLAVGHARITYTKTDSIKVVSLLNAGAKQPKSVNLMLFYGEKLLNVPYVAHTLEVNKTEQLVVNLRQLDCTTFVETVLALVFTTKSGSCDWNDYCTWLEKIRYQHGRVDGYPSRNHYFLWWVENNGEKGLVTLPLQNETCSLALKQTINIDYMTAHPSYYSMLKGNQADINAIAKMEKASKGKTMLYIPASKTGLSAKHLVCIKDGDILAIATKKKGLDTTHLGIAVWGRDGKLHLLNASQIHKKVVIEPMTLEQYMSRHPSQLGVWVVRPIFPNNR